MAWTKQDYSKLRNRMRFRRWVKANPDRAKAIQDKYVKNRPEVVKAKAKRWRQRNLVRRNMDQTKRHASKMQRTPSWLTEEHIKQMKSIYELAHKKTRAEGIQYEVDHILPLQGKNVSGLHVPWNLQVLTASENSRKKNHV